MTYLLDTNVFIQAKNLHYGFDFCPAFWQWLIDSHAGGRVFSIDKVADEIAEGKDELTQWVHDYGNGLFRKTDNAVTDQFKKVSIWVDNQKQYKDADRKNFLGAADFYLVAHALAGRHIVVTHETLVPENSTKKIKIPNVCNGLGLRSMTPYEMLRVEKARFVLGDRQS